MRRRGGSSGMDLLAAAASRWRSPSCQRGVLLLAGSRGSAQHHLHRHQGQARGLASHPNHWPITRPARSSRLTLCPPPPNRIFATPQTRRYARQASNESNDEEEAEESSAMKAGKEAKRGKGRASYLEQLDELEDLWDREVERMYAEAEAEEGEQQTAASEVTEEPAQENPGLEFDIDPSTLEFDSNGLAFGMVEADDITYVGHLNKEGRPHGMGRLTYGDGVSLYTGEWHNGHRHGWGKLAQEGGDVFEGEWEYGMLSGEARLSQANGAVFDGQWQNNRPFGEGRYVMPDGTVFAGIWGKESDFDDPAQTSETGAEPRSSIAGAELSADETDQDVVSGPDSMVGIGTIRYANRSFYDGEWRNLRPHGYGQLIFEDGSEYNGDFENGAFHGVGRLRYANKAEYEGEWKSGRKQGRGRMTNPDGKIETGHWKRDRLVQLDQDEEQYTDSTKSFLMGGRHTPRSNAPEVMGPAEPRGKWAGRFSGRKKPAEIFGDAALEPDEEDELNQPEPEDLPGGRPRRRGEGLTQGKYKSTSYNKWEPLNQRGRN